MFFSSHRVRFLQPEEDFNLGEGGQILYLPDDYIVYRFHKKI